ncbi:hypothetical protein Q8A67_003064 [Cirrhinus molitorella]|uniref:SH3 domain-containing protein n=1 Tax=Cirrhinus molitorella TaxID=172907 RepID=A0AA88QCN5_9TELE|nr:hypothetical protein Q8A67_003064 [Cirrhinus molitorella]
MCSVRFMVMYVDESVDVFYADGRRLQLSPCGSEFMVEKHMSPSAHPLQPRERVRQRTRFAISEYKTLVLNALEFRNKYATHPYLPEELITVEFSKMFTSAITEVEWPGSDSCTTDPHGEITVCSVDGHAKLVLSSSGEEFTVEFICHCSQNEVESQYLQLQGHQHKSTCSLFSLSSKSATFKSLNLSEASSGAWMGHHGTVVNTPNTERLESTSLMSGKTDAYTRVIQQYSRALFPQMWSYPLSLAFKHWESQKSQLNTVDGQNGKGSTEPQTGLKTKLPKPLPLKCPSPHQHRWRYDAVNPGLLEQEEEITAELVKVVWCKGIIYRIVDGVIPMVEISPGDGSTIRSNGVLANYFTHYKAGAAHRDAVECVYYLCGLPPDVPGQLYSVQSVVTRASRILKCFIQARSSLRSPLSLYCWNEQAALCDCARVVQEVMVAGTGYFKALSDGTVEVLFLDGVRVQMMWKSDTHTPAQYGEMEQRLKTETHRWCQLSLPDGHQTLVQVETDQTYQRYVSAVVQWCDWVKQTDQSMNAMGVSLSDSAHSDIPQPITCRSVVSELEKIKRFNFLLENSPVLRPTGRSLSCERSSDQPEIELTENCISEALQKTSKAIKDIDTLLSDRSAAVLLHRHSRTGWATFSNVQSLTSRFNSLAGESMYSQPAQNNQFRSAGSHDQNPMLIPKPVKLKPVDMNKGTVSKPMPKPLMVKPNFTVNSMETRFNPPVSSNKSNGDSGSVPVGVKLLNKGKLENANTQAPSGARSQSPSRPPIMQKPVLHEKISTAQGTATSDLSVPKKKTLPSVFALGMCPTKPQRPPHVNLDKFRENVSNTSNPEESFPLPPPLLPDRLSITSETPPPPPDFRFPPAPPSVDEEGYYDDTDVISRTETSLGKSSNDAEESDEEMYEDLDHNWPENNKETKEEKTPKESKELKKKLEKEEKKRLEQEKKEKKEREKREQEARKKFKIKGPIAVVETVKASVDHKGGKNKLPLKQGESIEIVRKTENPKDYWLARNSEGHYGFVKPDTLDVVRSTQDGEQEVYDDVGAAECDTDIYDCTDDPQADFSFLPPPPPDPPLFSVTDETYDDIIQADFPPPPPSPNSFPKFSSTSKTDVMDPKKKKKFEKEEKEFRKKFKYNAEIEVLYQATVLQSLSIKKFGNKDLPIKPGEIIDVISHPVDDKIIARNSEGKFGYVSTANLEDDGCIYDDVGDECIYDND